MLIDGLGKRYVFKELRATSTAGVTYADEPVKGRTSHVVEAFQYLYTHVAAWPSMTRETRWRGVGGSRNGGWCENVAWSINARMRTSAPINEKLWILSVYKLTYLAFVRNSTTEARPYPFPCENCFVGREPNDEERT
ncbi:hypothetical protein AWB71_04299 [Caballeronia peredens]|nr:hypothetical protein AWB71_04299 [Caballeronia peredens]